MGNLPPSSGIAIALNTIDTRLAVIEITVKRLEVCLYGNGKPGLSDEHKRLEVIVLEHHKNQEEDRKRTSEETRVAKELLAEETKAARELLAQQVKDEKDRREKISGRTWAVTLVVITAFVGLVVGQIVIYLQLLRTP